MLWFEINLNVPEALKDSVTNRLFELGAEGVSEGEGKDTGVLRAFFDESCRSEVDSGLPPFLESVAEIFPELPPVQMKYLPVETQNWADRYKEHYFPQKLTHTFFLKPAWCEDVEVPEGMLPIVLEPGQAFGTGLHASTRLCLSMMEHVLDLHPQPGKMRVIDVGTGTGILAIGARKLGMQSIVANDIDPIAVEAARENFELNGCPGIEVSTAPLASFAGPFDLILSNILLETHKELVGEYRRLLAPGGHVILSGLLGHQKAEIEEVFAREGFAIESTETLQEWLSVVCFRPDAG